MDETGAMHRALELAGRGLGRVEPNPMVGAVLLAEGRVIGEGWHGKCGGSHAEVNALRDAEAREESGPSQSLRARLKPLVPSHETAHDFRGGGLRGVTMCVTLEPCCHQGKTPPCTEALIAAGVGRVVVAMIDPDPRVAGGGVQRLREAGIEVEVGLCEVEARRLNEAFIKRTNTGLPWVIAKWAQTLDGKIATVTGDSRWISNEQSRRRVHELRARVDAVMVGVGTVINDDPLLTARDVAIKRTARRVVVDRSGRLPYDARMLRDGGPPVTILESDLRRGLAQLAEEGVTNVLVEGGASLLGSLFNERLIDQLLVFCAPKIVGDANAIPAVRGMVCDEIHAASNLQLIDVERLGDDVLLDYRVEEQMEIGG